MYAVIKSGGKQYRVSEGDTLQVEKIDAETGDKVEFGEVMMIGDGDDIQLGSPLMDGAKVLAEVTAHVRGKKQDIVKFKRRKHHLKRGTHRQDYTQVRITGIQSK